MASETVRVLVGTRKAAFVYTADAQRRTWDRTNTGFGFSEDMGLAIETAWSVCPGQLAVYRTRDAGASWDKLTDGLPGPHDYQSVYREAMDTDGVDPEGVYVGTSNGEVYASIDGGDHWERLPGTLPPILSIRCAVY